MTIWRSLLSRSSAAPDRATPEIAQLANAIADRLRALDLVVASHAHGRHFHEIFASSSSRMIVLPDSMEASGVAILLAGAYAPPSIVFERINSITPGLGRRMVAAVIDSLREHPGVFTQLRVNDLSPFQKDGRRWWEHVAEENADFTWIVTHDPDATHWETRAK